MTYHLEPWIEKIISPIVLLYSDGTRQEFQDGKALAEKLFIEPYRIIEVRSMNNTIEIILGQTTRPNAPTFF